MKKERYYFTNLRMHDKSVIAANFLPQEYQLQPETVLWRYLSTEQFLSMLSTKSLHFARLDTLEDPFEGYPFHLNSEEFRDMIQLNRNSTFVNCWHENQNESEYMWKHHGIENSVAIRTSYDSFIKGIKNDTTMKPPVQISRIVYVDSNEDVNTSVEDREKTNRQLFPYFYKRKQFEYEQEVRAVCPLHLASDGLSIKEFYDVLKQYPKGFYFPVCLDSLIEEIVVSPTSEKWYYDLIANAIRQYQLNIDKLRESVIQISPLWNHDTYADILLSVMGESTEQKFYYRSGGTSGIEIYTISSSGKIESVEQT